MFIIILIYLLIFYFYLFQYEIELQSFEVLPSLTDKDTIDPKTLRLKQSHRNSFVISGDFEIKQNFAKDDKVCLNSAFIEICEKSFKLEK